MKNHRKKAKVSRNRSEWVCPCLCVCVSEAYFGAEGMPRYSEVIEAEREGKPGVAERLSPRGAREHPTVLAPIILIPEGSTGDSLVGSKRPFLNKNRPSAGICFV